MSLAPWMYVVLLGFVCLVYAQLLPRKEKTAPSGDMMKELEQSMEMFASDMEEQNESLLQLFSDTKRDYEGHLSKLSGRMEQLEKQNHQLVQELSRPRIADLQQTASTSIAPSSHTLPAHAEDEPNRAAAMPDLASEPAHQVAPVPEKPSREPLLMNVKERYSELFRLHDQNKSVEYIAKKLSMNKGEVQLIIQLAKQEERAHV